MRVSKCILSTVVLSSFHQDEDLSLKSPKIIVNKELDEAVLIKSSSKLDKKFSNSILSCLRDTFRQAQYILYNFARNFQTIY